MKFLEQVSREDLESAVIPQGAALLFMENNNIIAKLPDGTFLPLTIDSLAERMTDIETIVGDARAVLEEINGTGTEESTSAEALQKAETAMATASYAEQLAHENNFDALTAEQRESLTPQRGTDYWTQEDIAYMKAYLDDVIINSKW